MTVRVRLFTTLLFAVVLLALGLAMRTALARQNAQMLIDDVYESPVSHSASSSGSR